MILTVTPNPLLDFVIHCPVHPGSGGHRIKTLRTVVGGKGINVARMLKTLGKPALALGFAGGPNGEKIRRLLRDQGISARFTETQAETRVGVNLVVDQPKEQTWWLEEGEELRGHEVLDFYELFQNQLEKSQFIAMSGTIPGRNHRDFYQKLLELSRGSRAEIYLDTHGEPLRKAMNPGGFFLKHNRDESRETFGLDPFAESDRKAWLDRLRESRVWGAMVTDGPGPILVWDPPDVAFVEPPPVVEVSAVGSGDAAMAGLIFGRANGMRVAEAVLWGIACGAADACHSGPCEAEFPEIEALFNAQR